MSEVPRVDATDVDYYLEHYGVRGMRWGVRKGSDSSGGTPRKGSNSSGGTPRKKALSKAEQERLAAIRAHRIQVGKDVLKAIVISVGTVGVAMVAGPVVAAGAGAIARSLPGPAFSIENNGEKQR